jgi:PAS domain S-box-containing protein
MAFDSSFSPNALRRYELLSENTRDIVLFIRPDGRILEANRAAVWAYGYERSELLAMSVHDLRAAESRPSTDSQMAAARAGGITFEVVHQRKDGTTFPVEVSSSPSEIGGILLSLVRDITARRRAETTNALLREIDRRILQREPQATVLRAICDRLADRFGYTLVWIAMKQPDGRVSILAHAGQAQEFLRDLPVRWDETLEGKGPTGTAIRTGESQLIPVSEPNWAPFRARALQHGLQSAVSLPLNAEGETLGALSIYSVQPDAFDQETTQDLTRFADQVAISLLSARDQERIRLQTAALEAAANAMVITDRNGVIQWANRAFTALTGYTVQEAVGQTPRLLKSGTHDEPFYRQMWETILAGQTWRGELLNRRRDGSVYVEEMTVTPVPDATGAVMHFIAVKQDVSERRRQEDQLRHLAMQASSADRPAQR